MQLRNGKIVDSSGVPKWAPVLDGQDFIPNPVGYPWTWSQQTVAFLESGDWPADKSYAFMSHLARTSGQWMPVLADAKLKSNVDGDWFGSILLRAAEELGREACSILGAPRTRARVAHMDGEWGYVQGIARLSREISAEWWATMRMAQSQN